MDGTYVLNNADQADGASVSDVVLTAAQYERRRHHHVQIEVVRYGSHAGCHLQPHNHHKLINICNSITQEQIVITINC